MISIDIDYFKSINDRHGHIEGDTLLSQIGDLILNNIRPYDRPIRIGGDEFLVIAPKLSYTDLLNFTERLRKKIAENIYNDGLGNPAYRDISASFGVLMLNNVDEPDSDPSYYLDLVDKNLREAKRKGRNRVEILTQN